MLTSFTLWKVVKTSLDSCRFVSKSSNAAGALKEFCEAEVKTNFARCMRKKSSAQALVACNGRAQTHSRVKQTFETYPTLLPTAWKWGANGGKTHCRTKQISKGCCIRGLAENQRTLAEGRKEWVKKVKKRMNQWKRKRMNEGLSLTQLEIATAYIVCRTSNVCEGKRQKLNPVCQNWTGVDPAADGAGCTACTVCTLHFIIFMFSLNQDLI